MSAAPFFTQPTTLTLTAAATLPATEWGTLSLDGLDLSDADRDRVARVWLWLCGVAPDDDEAGRVRREVLTDGGLIVGLSLPAVEFVCWFRGAAWADFDSTERTGSEDWAWAALQRAWRACEALGVLAGQVPMQCG